MVKNWRKDTMRRYTKADVRIARCMVSPEFRGLKLASPHVRHAISLARYHWQVARLKPPFLEITADMLRYVPFIESAGMMTRLVLQLIDSPLWHSSLKDSE